MGHKFRGSTPLSLATIFSFILDSNKLNKIKEKYDCDNIEQQLVDGRKLYVFEEGFKKQEVIIENLDDNDINILYNFMKIKLEVVFNIILKGKKDDIKTFLGYGILLGQSWDYSIPEALTFEEFLQKLQLNYLENLRAKSCNIQISKR